MDALRKAGVDPLGEAVQYAHSMGIDLIPSLRMDGTNPPPYNASPGPFFDQHPEYLCRAADGSIIPRLSLAFPEVRQLYLSMFREALDYGVDGIAVLFNRGWPFVAYERPVADGFQSKYGLKPQELDAKDPRWLAHKADFVTTYVRSIRQLLDEEGGKRGRRLQAVMMVAGNAERSLELGLDLPTWIKEGLVDHLILHPSAGGDIRAGAGQVAALARGSKTRVYVDFYPRRLPAEMIRRRAIDYYQSGIDAFRF